MDTETSTSLPPLPNTCAQKELKNSRNASVTITLFPFAEQGRPGRPVMFDPITQPLDERSGSTSSLENDIVSKMTLGRRVEPKDTDGNRPSNPGNVILEPGFVGFKSKVVSRTHAEIWVRDGQVMYKILLSESTTNPSKVFFKDVGSSSGTFLNHMRLSPSNRESRPYPLRDGDVIQLGVDYQQRQEDIYKAVVMKVLIQSSDPSRGSVDRNKLHTALKTLIQAAAPLTQNDTEAHVDCAICLNNIAPFQALFLAPCSHCFHFKCIRPLIGMGQNDTMFLCPMCRQVANLEASVSSENLLADTSALDSATEAEDEQPLDNTLNGTLTGYTRAYDSEMDD